MSWEDYLKARGLTLESYAQLTPEQQQIHQNDFSGSGGELPTTDPLDQPFGEYDREDLPDVTLEWLMGASSEDILKRFGLSDEYAEFLPSYEDMYAQQEEFITGEDGYQELFEDEYGIQQDIFDLTGRELDERGRQIGAEYGLAMEGVGLERERLGREKEKGLFGARESLFDIMQSQREQGGGFASQVGGFEYGRARKGIQSKYKSGLADIMGGYQAADLESERFGERRRSGMAGVEFGQERLGYDRGRAKIGYDRGMLGFEEDIYGYQSAYRDTIYDRLMDIMGWEMRE